MSDDLTNTAKDFYLVRLCNGAVPLVWEGGELDGLEYLPLTLEGVDYIHTAEGLFLPPASDGNPAT